MLAPWTLLWGEALVYCNSRYFRVSTWVTHEPLVNSLWSNDARWRHNHGSTLATVMRCCPTTPSHYLNQCWLIIMMYCGIHVRTFEKYMLHISIHDMNLKIIRFFCKQTTTFQIKYSLYHHVKRRFNVIIPLELCHVFAQAGKYRCSFSRCLAEQIWSACSTNEFSWGCKFAKSVCVCPRWWISDMICVRN